MFTLIEDTKTKTLSILLMALLPILLTAPAQAVSKNIMLTVTPEQCVALRKGQTCYLEVTFAWQHPTAAHYCLVNTSKNKVLKCWQGAAKGQYSFDFQGTKTNEFTLRDKLSGKDLASAQVVVAWVYKSNTRSKSRWRLF